MSNPDDQPTELMHPAFSSEPLALPRLSQLGPYRLGKTLGWGGMGIVYAAEDTRNGEQVAVKLLRFADAGGVSQRRFQKEAEATRQLNHPGIVGLREVGRHESYDYYTMDLVEGRDFGTWLREEKPTLHQAVRVLAEVARAADHAHRRGILHRDLKPSNIIVREDGSPAITDFGLARAIGVESSLTAADQAVGTPGYMSPEQARGQHLDCGPGSDVWSLGVMLYEACSGGHSPFGGDTILETMHQVVTQDPVLPRIHSPSVSPAIERIAMQCLEKRAHDRYPSAAALAEDLERYLGGMSVHARRYSSWTRAMRWSFRRWRPVLLGSLVVLLVAAVGALGWARLGTSGSWVPAYEWQRGDPVAGAGMIFTEDGGPEVVAAWSEGEHGLKMRHGVWCWLEDLRLPGDVRVELTVRTGAVVDGIEIVINGAVEAGGIRGWAEVPPGYSCQFGGYNGALDFISRNHVNQITNFTYATPSILQPESEHHLVFQRIGDRLELEVDGRSDYHADFPVPLVAEGMDSIGIRTYADGVEVLALRVQRLAGAEREAPLLLGDTALRLGRVEAAIDEYLAVAAARPGEEVAGRALTRAYLVGLQREDYPDERLVTIRTRLERGFAGSGHLALLREFDAADAALGGDWGQAISLMDEAHDHDPDSRIALRVLQVTHGPKEPDAVATFLAAIGRSRHVRALRLTDRGITDLSPLQGLPLIWLDLSSNPVTDLSPLRDMPLRYLSLYFGQLRDLRPLHGLPLNQLSLGYNQITDLSPLRGLPLTWLALEHNPLADLKPIHNPSLRALDIRATGLRSLDQLRGLQLSRLSCAENPISDLEPLRGMPLTILDCSHTLVSDLEPVVALQLNRLACNGARLARLPEFTGGRLERLEVADNRISDLSPLAGLPLHWLDASGNEIADLAPLQGAPLQVLHVADNHLREFPPLGGSTFGSLICYGNPLEQVAGILASEQRVLLIGDGRHQLGDAAIEALVAGWRDDPGQARHVAALQALRSWRTEPEQARSWARAVAGVEAVCVLRWLPYAQARALAAAVGGRLATREEAVELESVLVPHDHKIWVEGGVVRAEDPAPTWSRSRGEDAPAHQRHPVLVVWDVE